MGRVDKFLVLPRGWMVAAGTGRWWVLRTWWDELRRADPDGLMEVVDAALARLRTLVAAYPGEGEAAAIAVLLGWDTRRERVAGYALASGDGFAPVEMPDGTGTTPTPSTADRDYARLYELSTRVGEGREAAEAFLLAAVANQLRTFVAGGYAAGFAAGGPLRLAEVTERGVECREVGEA